MEKDPVLEKYKNEGFGKNAFGWYFNPWISEYDEDYDPHNDKEYNKELDKEKLEWHPDLTEEQIMYAKEKDIYEPKGQEYEQFLKELGIVKNNSEKPDKTNGENKGPGKSTGSNGTPDKGTGNKEETDKDEGNKEETDIAEKREVESIIFSPIGNSVICNYNINQKNLEELKSNDSMKFNYTEKEIEDIRKVIKNVSANNSKLDGIIEAIDPNILKWFVKNEKNLNIKFEDYIGLLSGKKKDFKIIYNLRNIYDSDLDYKQIKNVTKIAEKASELSNGAISVEKDNLLKQVFGNIKKRWSYFRTEKLAAGDEQENDKKEKYAPRHFRKRNVLDKPKAVAKDLGDRAVFKARRMGTGVADRIKHSRIGKAFINAAKAFRNSYKSEVNSDNVSKDNEEVKSDNQIMQQSEEKEIVE